MYYLVLAGLIPGEQHAEFEQTYGLVSGQMPTSCTGYQINRDKKNLDIYRFVSYWSSPEELKAFRNTPAYVMLNGAFSTLGELTEHSEGKMSVPSNLSERENVN